MADEKMTSTQLFTRLKTWINGKLGNITALIPSQATSSNQLADKAFVNSSIATATATFRGTYNLVTDLSLTPSATQQQIATALATAVSTKDNNDYAFVQVPTDASTPTEIARVDRYKYNGSAWAFEYSVNNSGFTAAQWATLNSGLVSGDKTKLDALPTNAELTILLNGKANAAEMSITDGTGANADKTTIQLKSGLSRQVLIAHQDISGKENSGNKVTEITEVSTDTQYSSAKSVWTLVASAVTSLKTWTLEKIDEAIGAAKEVVTVTATADSGSVSSAVLTVKIGDTVVATGTSPLSLNVVYGKEYTVEASRVNDYLTPVSQAFTANQAVRSVIMAYTYIQRDTITIDQTQTDETAMVSGDVQGDVIKAIRAASHLYLGTQTEAGNQVICQLKDSDGTKYDDGTTAALDGSEGDQWMKLPIFWWKVTGAGADQFSISFAFAGEPDSSWHKWEGGKNLLAVHKMYVSSSKGYSRSSVVGTANYTQPNGKTYARARGTGYTLVTWEWHCMMAALFYAWYGRMNAQAQCGLGSNSNTRTLGTKDSLGMTDTTSSNGNADNTKFWGIENWWGDISEWLDNITSSDYVLTLVGMDDGVTRSPGTMIACGGTGGYTSKMAMTENLDFVPKEKAATDSSGYCDWVNANTGSRVVSRSYNSANAHGGVACVNANIDSSFTVASCGSRLAFNGTLMEAESVAAYKALFA